MRKIKEEKNKRAYLIPVIEVLSANNDCTLLADSPAVQPGGGGSGNVGIDGPIEDNSDTDATGAKRFSLWGDRED